MDRIEFVNFIPKFLSFYNKASKSDVTKVKRWELWEELYGFAAVPPGDQGKETARQLLKEAWNRYPEMIEKLKSWSPDEEKIKFVLTKVKQALDYNQSIDLVILHFVGGFEGNCFTAPYDEHRKVICIPIEVEIPEVILAHELTHVVHGIKAKQSSGWERTIGSLILEEGIATQASKLLVPGLQDKDYIEHRAGWFEKCNQKRKDILTGIKPYLFESKSEFLYKFTFEKGTTGIEREGYYAGWELVDYALKKGATLGALAEIEEENIPVYIEQLLHEYLEQETSGPSKL
ncbi:DUF2268 domain-containing putative Zn-dependent protease [Bacillus litorisediminis]|uniref:DUF2268 domain-containing putative Zn-dependent protease n=1 Tax=Bacillus litorisediminis TaxID=2922713 RepID=UPI001FAC1952|nr:DUF2268 domain-containing putative Zn-dependent protease [Bacillus litorisediminis]